MDQGPPDDLPPVLLHAFFRRTWDSGTALASRGSWIGSHDGLTPLLQTARVLFLLQQAVAERQKIPSSKSLMAPKVFREKIEEILGYLPSHRGVRAATTTARSAPMSDPCNPCTVGYKMGLIASSIAVRNIFVYTTTIVHENLPGDPLLIRDLKDTIVSMYDTAGEAKLRQAIVNDYQDQSQNADIFQMAVPRYIQLGMAYSGLYVMDCAQHTSVFGALDPLITLHTLQTLQESSPTLHAEWLLRVLQRLFGYVAPPRGPLTNLIGVSSLWFKAGPPRASKGHAGAEEGAQTLLGILSGQLYTPVKTWNRAASLMCAPEDTSHKRRRLEHSSAESLASLPPLFLRAFTETGGSNASAGGPARETLLCDQGCSDTDSVLWRQSIPSGLLGTEIPDILVQSVRMRQAVLEDFHTSQDMPLPTQCVNTVIDVVAGRKTFIYNHYIKNATSGRLDRTRFVCDCVMSRVLAELGAPPHFWSMHPIHSHRRLRRQDPGSVTCRYGRFAVQPVPGGPIDVGVLQDEPQPARRIYEALASRAEGYHAPSKRPLLLNKITVRVWAKAHDPQPPIVHEYRYHPQSVFKNKNLDTQIDPPLSCIDVVGELASRTPLARQILIGAESDPFQTSYNDYELQMVCDAVSEMEARMK